MISANYIISSGEFEFLPFSVKSIEHVVDEYVFILNNPDMRTYEIFLKINAELIKTHNVIIEEIDEIDFALLRNRAFDLSSNEWIMKIDCDEVFYDSVVRILDFIKNKEEQIEIFNCYFYHLLKDFQHTHNNDANALYVRPFVFRKNFNFIWKGIVHEALKQRIFGYNHEIFCDIDKNKFQDTDIFYVHYGYTKPQCIVFERWKLYSDLEGDFEHYKERDPNTILDDREMLIFEHEHPEVIKEYIKSGVRLNYRIEKNNHEV